MPAFEIKVLRAVEHAYGVAVAAGAGGERRRVRAGFGLGHGEGGHRLAAGDRGSHALALGLGCRPRVIGIEPRHWRAKTASASGEAAARASRMRQQARRSGSGQWPP